MATESIALDGIDRQILHALQISPRAPFARIGTVLGVSEQTVARRYQRLRTHGVVRVTALPDPTRSPTMSYWTLRINCAPGTAMGLADALARRSDTSWVGVGAGGAEVNCMAVIDDDAGVNNLLHHVPRASSVLSFSAHQMLHRFTGRGEVDWIARGHELGEDQKKALLDGALVAAVDFPAPRSGTVTDPLLPSDAPLIAALNRDARASWATLAEAAGLTQRQVARRVEELVTAGAIYFHLDVAHAVIGLRAVASLWFTIAPADLASVGAQLADHIELAFAAAITGQTNLMASALCTDPQALYRYLTTEVAAIKGIQTVETVPRLQQVKQAFFRIDNGHLREP